MSDEAPILFSAPMVRAILNGTKTMTRRVMKPQPEVALGIGPAWRGTDNVDLWATHAKWKMGKICWVRENFWERPARSLRDLRDGADTWPPYVYDADEGVDAEQLKEWGWAHRPSIHLPRKASRITLEVTAVRCEQLQQITTRDAIAEGVEYDVSLPDGAPTMRFHYLWDSIHVKDGFNWKANPFVFVVSFKRISP